MTAEHPNRTNPDRLLEKILQTVHSIDRNVEEILDRMSDYMAGIEHGRDWHEHGYDLGSDCAYEPD